MLSIANQVGDEEIIELEEIGDLQIDGVFQSVQRSKTRYSGVGDQRHTLLGRQ